MIHSGPAMGLPMSQLMIVFVGAVLVMTAARVRGQAVASRFGALGDLERRTKADVVRVVGAPVARAELAGGGEVLDWQAWGLHVTLMFDARDRCVGITRCTY
jgi:hypothetical protein